MGGELDAPEEMVGRGGLGGFQFSNEIVSSQREVTIATDSLLELYKVLLTRKSPVESVKLPSPSSPPSAHFLLLVRSSSKLLERAPCQRCNLSDTFTRLRRFPKFTSSRFFLSCVTAVTANARGSSSKS